MLDALRLLKISDAEAADIGLRLWKVGLVWPLDPMAARDFADGLETVLVIEERRDLIEYQLKTTCSIVCPNGRRPVVIGKTDAQGRPLVRDTLDLDTAHVALAPVRRLAR